MEKTAMEKLAFELGTKVAMEQIKIALFGPSEDEIRKSQLWGLGLGPIAAGLSAPEGKKLPTFLGSWGGQALGSAAGGLSGAGIGGLLGRLHSPQAALASALGLGITGALGGGAYGGWKGTEYGMNQ